MNTFRQAVSSIRKERFDVSVDLYFYYTNCNFLTARANIPNRIGYRNAGFSNLLTDAVEWPGGDESVLKYHIRLLKELPGFNDRDLPMLKPAFNNFPKKNEERMKEILGGYEVRNGEYLLFHIATGLAIKEWPVEKWKQLTAKLSEYRYPIVFTGQGDREAALIREVIGSAGGHRCIDLSNQLSLTELFMVVKSSKLLVCSDSLAGHAASAFDTPCVVIGNGINPPKLWQPVSSVNRWMIHPVPCIPCFTGCAEMNCVRDIGIEAMFSGIAEVLAIFAENTQVNG
ncbi:glycosyltransferase family 9 protein [Hufsiella ginkgonis]|uniref:Glycosyltransferase family 9 protein n=1 Tax=Hufsiella ginkgonis TaxID=2695274 RepID=A0A7K1Y2C2_9SPHI|nr:glycosyltransferase family 9 protein [Hufsiella ginkgonis]MXV17391.1 hypothetical protein [Hufsiella ginkgonis]